MIDSNKYCFQLDQLKAAINEKNLKLVQKKDITYQDNANKTDFLDNPINVRNDNRTKTKYAYKMIKFQARKVILTMNSN